MVWSPLGSGFLTDKVGELAENDFRQNSPRFAGDSLAANRDRFAPLLALAWLLHQGDDIVPIPGTRSVERVDENARAAAIQLDAETPARIDELAPPGLAEGATLMQD